MAIGFKAALEPKAGRWWLLLEEDVHGPLRTREAEPPMVGLEFGFNVIFLNWVVIDSACDHVDWSPLLDK